MMDSAGKLTQNSYDRMNRELDENDAELSEEFERARKGKSDPERVKFLMGRQMNLYQAPYAISKLEFNPVKTIIGDIK
jgi:uncharacterized membrane protein (DUF106 family)